VEHRALFPRLPYPMVPAQNSWATFLQRTVDSVTPASSGTPRHSNGTAAIAVVLRITKRFRTPELRSNNFPALPRLLKSTTLRQTKPNDLIVSRVGWGMLRDRSTRQSIASLSTTPRADQRLSSMTESNRQNPHTSPASVRD
jgi:hypothetical protein